MGNELVNRQIVKLERKTDAGQPMGVFRTIGFVFDDVPDHLKKPPGSGPFEQVPAGFDASITGLWWRVTPFNPTPWAALNPQPPLLLPDGFETIFGGRPHTSHFSGGNSAKNVRVATVTWESNLKTYVGPGMPDDADAAKVEAANDEAVKHGMGEPAYYENNNGFRVRFPDSDGPHFEAPFDGFVNTGTGQVIVSYQNHITNDGIIIPVGKIHRLAPPPLQKKQDDLRVAARKAAAEKAGG